MINIAADIEQVRNESDAFLIDTCEVLQRQRVTIAGEVIETYVSMGEIPCRFITRQATIVQSSQSSAVALQNLIGAYGLHVPRSTVVQEYDRIQYKGVLFIITSAPIVHAFTGALVLSLNKVE